MRPSGSGRVTLLVATSIGYDLEPASEERRLSRQKWLHAHTFIDQVPGPFVVGVTRIGRHALVADSLREPLARLRESMSLGNPPSRREMIDYHHLTAAVMHPVAAFVTTDRDDILRRSAAIKQAAGLAVLDPSDALALVP